jgi:translation initiation factor IF-3
VNNAIRVPEVRVVNEDGQQLGIMSPDAARDIAGRLGLDLVEISPNASPPVVKIMDYGRYKYDAKKKAAAAKKTQHQSQVKEVKFRPQINEHDLDFKLNNARRFLQDGDKVKCTVMFRGREIVHAQLGRDLLALVSERLADLAKPETQPQMEGRMLSMLLTPDHRIVERLRAERARSARAEPEPEPAQAEPTDEERSSA